MPSFCIIINENTKESTMWVGKNREEGKWFDCAPEDFEGSKEFARVLQTCPDPEALMFEIGQAWSDHYNEEDEDNS